MACSQREEPHWEGYTWICPPPSAGPQIVLWVWGLQKLHGSYGATFDIERPAAARGLGGNLRSCRLQDPARVFFLISNLTAVQALRGPGHHTIPTPTTSQFQVVDFSLTCQHFLKPRAQFHRTPRMPGWSSISQNSLEELLCFQSLLFCILFPPSLAQLRRGSPVR